jgi:hypothetical protein
MTTDSNNNLVPTIYDTLISQQNRPISINFPETVAYNSQILPNQTLTFSSQPVIKAPPKITLTNKNHTHGPFKAQTDPKITQPVPSSISLTRK